MNREISLVCLLSSSLLLLPATAHSTPVTIRFEAIVTGVSDYFEVLPPIAAGDRVTGTYRYDGDAAPYSVSAGPLIRLPDGTYVLDPEHVEHSRTQYIIEDPWAGIEFEVNGARISLMNSDGPDLPLLINLYEDYQYDAYFLNWIRTAPTTDPSGPLLDQFLIDIKGIDVLSSSEPILSPLPLTVPSLPSPDLPDTVIDMALLRYTARAERNRSGFDAQITSISLVPEPGLVALILLASSGLLLRATAIRLDS